MFFNKIRSSQAATEKNGTSSKTKIIKYARGTRKDSLKTADVRKFRVNAALLHFEVNPIAPVYCRGLQIEQLHKDVLEDAAAPGGLSPVPDVQMVGYKTSKYFLEGRGVRERKSRRMILASITGGGCVVEFRAAQKRQALQHPGLCLILPRYQDS